MDTTLRPVMRYAPYFFKIRMYRKVRDKVLADIKAGKEIYPTDPFRAFRLCTIDDVKVVILGQDPYHDGKADGLAFSIKSNIKFSGETSLSRILREYCNDLGFNYPKTNELTEWAERGVLLLNTTLTVEKGKPNSHVGYGWFWLIRETIRRISKFKEKVVFILWGKQAQMYRAYIDETKHLVLAHCHPSPLTGKAWWGNKHFSKTCEYLGLQHEFWKLRS